MALPLAERKRQIEALRAQSQRQKDIKHAAIMDVNAAAVTATFRKYELTQMIHGHTHLPAYHPHDVDGHICERWVLADWYKTGSYLECDAKGCRSIALA